MRKLILFFVAALLIPAYMLNAQNTKRITLSYNEADFTLSSYADNETTIDVGSLTAMFKPDSTSPGLPFIPVNVLIPSNSDYSDFSSTVQKRLLKENVNLTQNPIPVTTDNLSSAEKLKLFPYSQPRYPASNVEYVGTNVMGGYTMVSFLVCPFEYDVQSKKLYFIDSFNLDINLSQMQKAPSAVPQSDVMKDVVKNVVVNGNELDEFYASPVASSDGNVMAKPLLDYLIITSSELAPSFMPLLKWKKAKGLKARIITTESIDEHYPGNSLALKIKSCLYDYHKSLDLKYALLGGDDTIVPVYYCYANYGKDDNGNDIEVDIPSDLFYVCYGGDFEWNANGNNKIGEVDDNVDFAPSVVLTRTPVRTPDDVSAFINKLLFYEKTPTAKGWDNNILMCGYKLKDQYPAGSQTSDAEAMGDNLYVNHIGKYWNGERKRFYDTCTDFEGGADYELNVTNLQNQLSKGYAFMDMITHGSQITWGLENGVYGSDNGLTQENIRATTIVTTNACSTNGFDTTEKNYYYNDPCLSESLIRNPESGVVAYLGCSREGWFYLYTNALGPSLEYEAKFYKTIFTSDVRNFGSAVASAKLAMVGTCGSASSYRWIQFGLNPIGDPEMPIFVDYPKKITGATISKDKNNVITVEAGMPGCRICAMSCDDMGASYYDVRYQAQAAKFNNVNTKVSVCITKQGYIPVYVEIDKNIVIQNETVVGPKTYDGNIIEIGSSVTDTEPQGDVVFNGGDVVVKGKSIVISNNTTVNPNTNLKMSNK